jgi:hypothetical protein
VPGTRPATEHRLFSIEMSSSVDQLPTCIRLKPSRRGPLGGPAQAAKCIEPKVVIWHNCFYWPGEQRGTACALKNSGALLHEVRMEIKELL